jgi:hypothetical protein
MLGPTEVLLLLLSAVMREAALEGGRKGLGIEVVI